MSKIGFHVGVRNKNYYEAFQHADSYGANAIQIWTGNPKSWDSSLFRDEKGRQYVEEKDIFLIAHSPYVLNFANPALSQKAKDRYISDCINVVNLGGVGSVLHMGYGLKQEKEDAMKVMIDHLEEVSKNIPGKIILENMSGKGSAIGCTIEDWGIFVNMLPTSLEKKVVWCVDTAHLHGVGEYNLSFRREVMRFYDDFMDHIGWNKILCFHFNGSSANLGSHHDLHADISGDMCGNIEGKGMRHLARIANETGKHLILETPCSNFPIGWQIATIRSWFDKSHPFHYMLR